jgi:2-polyprenyl-3-methyl-5-hydroxy-6-metoxy-1,4-benzoquinol methylase
MTLTEEYKNQNTWRNWETYIECLPIGGSETILDLGCSNGFVTKLLAQRASQVIGIDMNADLLNEACTENGMHNIQYILIV